MVAAFDVRRQQFAGKVQRFFNIFQGLYLEAQQRVDHGQIVGRIWETDFGIGIVGFQRSFIFTFYFGDDVVTTLDGGECYQSRHEVLLR